MWRQGELVVVWSLRHKRGEPMTVATIDTLEVAKELRAAGFTDDQAAAVTRVVRRVQDVDVSSITTRTDLAVLRADLEKSLAETKAEILKWMVSTIGLQTVVIIGAVIGLIKLLH